MKKNNTALAVSIWPGLGEFVELARSLCITHGKVYRFICPVCGGIVSTRYSGIENPYLCVCCLECKMEIKSPQ